MPSDRLRGTHRTRTLRINIDRYGSPRCANRYLELTINEMPTSKDEVHFVVAMVSVRALYAWWKRPPAPGLSHPIRAWKTRSPSGRVLVCVECFAAVCSVVVIPDQYSATNLDRRVGLAHKARPCLRACTREMDDARYHISYMSQLSVPDSMYM